MPITTLRCIKAARFRRYRLCLPAATILLALAPALTAPAHHHRQLPGARAQTSTVFGTCLSGTQGEQSWWRALYFDDLQCSIVRMDLTPAFKAPFTGVNGTFNSPWYHNNPGFPGPQNQQCPGLHECSRLFRHLQWLAGAHRRHGPGCGSQRDEFRFQPSACSSRRCGCARGMARTNQLGDSKLIGSYWSPAPWLKISSGNKSPSWGGTPMPSLHSVAFCLVRQFCRRPTRHLGYRSHRVRRFVPRRCPAPTSALTQFVRGAAAFVRAFQRTNNVRFYAISIQNEVNFEEFYNSCTYPLSALTSRRSKPCAPNSTNIPTWRRSGSWTRGFARG